MKVLILTLHSVCNYGTQLQALATQELFKKYFDDVGFIDYRRDDTHGIKLIKTFSKGNLIRLLAILPTILYWHIIFCTFQKKYLNITKPYKLSSETIHKSKFEANAYIVGSDQVWNSGWNGGVIPEMYLDFIENTKLKYSFSSSFGRTSLAEEEIKKSKKYIENFSYISVREESGVEILKKQYNYNNVVKIIDPTLLLGPEFWRKFYKKRKIKEKYILIYNLNSNKDFDNYAERVSKKTGLKLYRFCTRFDQIIKNGKSLVIPPILDFINYIDNAEYVITDSFHATAFSINLNTIPICLYPSNYSNRISEFLKLVNLEKCHPKSYNDYEVLSKKINFNEANDILESERRKADNYIKKIREDVNLKNEKKS